MGVANFGLKNTGKLLAILTFLIAVSSSSVYGATIWVDFVNGNDLSGNGSLANPYKTLTKGVTVAITNDTVIAKKGTYSERVTINKNIVVTSEFGRDSTVIHANTSGSTVIFSTGATAATKLNGFRIQGGIPSNVDLGGITSTVGNCRLDTAAQYAMRNIHPQGVSRVLPTNIFAPRLDHKFNAYLISAGAITESTTWPEPDSGFCYLTYQNADVAVSGPADPTLTLLSGTMLKFWGSQSSLLIGGSGASELGKLMADGVIFTSWADDTLGDASGEGVSQGAAGQWESIVFRNYADDGSRMDSCIVRYGGTSWANAAVLVEGSDPSIEGCLFTQNAYSSLLVTAENTGNKIKGNTFLSSVGTNSWPVRLHPGAVDSVVANNTFNPRSDGKFNAYLVFAGAITESTTWPVPDSGFCYYLYDDYVQLNNSSAVWTLLPGTLIKSAAGTDIRIDGGQFMADGVVFTCRADDTLGDVDNSGASSGAPHGWEALQFNPNASDNSVVSNCVIRYGGNNSYDAGMILNNAVPTVTGCLIVDNGDGGLLVNMQNGGDKVKNNRFESQAAASNNLWPVRLHPGAVDSVVTNNTFIPRSDGKFNAYLVFAGAITESTTWPVPDSGFCYGVYADYVQLNNASAVWGIDSGTVVKFWESSNLYLDAGRFMAAGVVFTSRLDDTLGDVDGSGTSTGAPDQWQAIEFRNAVSDSSELRNCVIRYGGRDSYLAALNLENAAPTIIGSTFASNADGGIYATGASSISQITNSTFTNNPIGIRAVSSADPIIHGCSFAGNPIFGVKNETSTITVNAEYNWWGSTYGPYHPTLNPLGLGDKVSDYVDFMPYMGAPDIPPVLTWSTQEGFIDDGVDPDTGMTLTEFEFRVVYSSPAGNPPASGYPRVKIDINGDGVIDTVNDGIYPMWSADAGQTYITGQEYVYQIYLPESGNIKYAFEAIDDKGLAATGLSQVLGWTNGPYLSNHLNDLEIHASDISLSKPHPYPFEDVIIKASVANNSPAALTNVLAYLYIGSDLVDSTSADLINVGYASDIFQFHYTFTANNFYSVRVVVDPHNSTNDWNRLNNSAARGVLVGDYVFSGGIDLNVYCPTVCWTDSRADFNVEAHYYGLGFSDSLPVAGATITYRIVETGGSPWTMYSNDYGRARGAFISPTNPSTYTLEVTLTDYTISTTERLTFEARRDTIIPCINKVSINSLNIDSCGTSLIKKPSTKRPFRTSTIVCPTATVHNLVESDFADVQVGAFLDGQMVGSLQSIPLLPALGQGTLPTFQLRTPLAVGNHNLTVKIDPNNKLQDCYRFDNTSGDNFRVWPDSDLVASAAGFNPNRPTVYDTLTLYVTVANVGYFPLGPITVAFINNGTGDTLGQKSINQIDEEGSQETVSLSNIVLLKGCHQIKMVVDPFNVIHEYNETNNIQYLTICIDTLLPDFQVSYNNFGLTNPALISPGDDSLYALVANIGNEDAAGVIVRFFEDGTPIGTDQIINLPHGMSVRAAVPYHIDFHCHTLSVRVDPTNAFRETNESNNFVSGIVPYEVSVDHLPACPDLFVPEPMFSACNVAVTGGETKTVTVRTRLRNNALLTTPEFQPTLTDGKTGTVYNLANASLPHHGGSVLLTNNVNFTTADAGAHTFTVYAGTPDIVGECDSSNNYYSGILTVTTVVPKPDLTLDLSVAGSCFAVTDMAHCSIAVSNIGKASSIASTVILFRDGVAIDTFPVPALTIGQSVGVGGDIPVILESIGQVVVLAKVDPANAISELDENNNEDQVVLASRPHALDFTLSSISFSPQSPDTTQVVKVSANVKNTGGLSFSGNLVISFTIEGYGAMLFDTITTLDSCFDEAQASVSFIFSHVGQNCVTVTIDPDNQITEYNESDNNGSACLTTHQLRPDLVIGTADINYTNSNPLQGEQVYIDIIVHNLGSFIVPSAIVKIFLGGVKLGADITVSVPAGGIDTARSTVPWMVDRTVPRSIRAVVDSANLIYELDETNNAAEICAVPELSLKTIAVCPDWNSVEKVFSRCPAIVDIPLTMKAIVVNSGAMDLSNTTSVRFYDTYKGPMTLLESTTFNFLRGHSRSLEQAISKAYTINDTGSHTITIVVDEDNAITECNESNLTNYPLTVITTLPEFPDLTTRSEFIDISNIHPEVGERVYVSATIRNNGPGPANNIGVRFLVDEVPLGSDILIPLLSGSDTGRQDTTIGATIPWEAINFPTPLHIVHVVIDPNESIQESIEDNNEATRATVVGDIADLAVSLPHNGWVDSCLPLGCPVFLSLNTENRGLIDASADLIAKQVIGTGDTVVLGTREIFLKSLSNEYQDYALTLNQNFMSLIYEFVNIYPEDYISENNSMVIQWQNCSSVCGDVNCNGKINALDITFLINYLYKHGPAPCYPWAADVNHSCSVNMLDITYMINWLYKSGHAPDCQRCCSK